MADPTVPAYLDSIARTLETAAGLSSDSRDETTVGRLQRIAAALPDAFGSGGLIVINLGDLDDVDTTTQTAGNFLRFNDPLWNPANLASVDLPPISLGDLSDVDTAGESVGTFLRFNGLDWVPLVPRIAFDISGVFSTLAANQVLLSSGGGDYNDVPAAAIGSFISHHLLLNLSADDHPQYLLTDGTRALTGAWDAQQDITASRLLIESTIDHIIYDSTDDFHIENLNADRGIHFQVTTGATTRDFVRIDGAGPSFVVDDAGTPVTALSTPGIVQITGDWGRNGAWGVMRFSPTLTAGTPVAFFIDPTVSGPVSAFGASSRHIVAAGQNLTYVGYEMIPGNNVSAGQTQTTTGFSDNRSIACFDAGSTWNRIGAQLGVPAAGSVVGAGAVVNDTHLSLHGGANQFLGTYTQYGIRTQGYGTAGFGATVYALHSDGGTFALAADNQNLNFGAAEDAQVYFDGADFVIDTDTVGAGTLKLISANNWLAVGGPAAPAIGTLPVGAAGAFAGWLSVVDNLGGARYIATYN